MESLFHKNLDHTIKDFEYTKKAIRDIKNVIESEDFEDMNAEEIVHFLLEKMDIIPFGEYLKRYIYEKAEIDMPYQEVPLELYKEILSWSLKENGTPCSFNDVERKQSVVLRQWLTAETVKRNTVFVLGFALKMTVEDVEEFLTKALREDSFNFYNIAEVIYWYCIKHGFPYAKAKLMLEEAQADENTAMDEKLFEMIETQKEIYLLDEENVKAYVAYLKLYSVESDNQERMKQWFEELYGRGQKIIADIYNETRKGYRYHGFWKPEDIQPSDFEDLLCSGIPRTKNGNLIRISKSSLASLFDHKRMSRQRIAGIMKEKKKTRRFDIITLLFLIFAETVEKDWPYERFVQFVERANYILNDCNMSGIYPANPYEAFILICLLSDLPLETYAEVWEKSY